MNIIEDGIAKVFFVHCSSCFNYYCISAARSINESNCNRAIRILERVSKRMEESLGMLLESFDSIAL